MDELKEIKYSIKLRDIKSFYIIKGIFSFLHEKQKLNIIIYNKELQKNLLVDIGDYRTISGKYKIGKKNGKGSEYLLNTNSLISKGEYLNGKRNGDGKEYYFNGEIRFEGIYNNGKKWNGIGYDIKANKVYEIKNGEGYIKEYNDDGELILETEYLNGKRNGKGKEYDIDGNLVFEGEYLYSHKLRGKYNINGKLEYEGEFLYDKKWNGKGYDENGNIIYEL